MTIRLLIVDDSTFMRVAIRKMVEKDKQISIVGEAKTGQEAVDLAVSLRPDVITMDIEMPGMNGVEATAEIMKRAPAAIIMVSSLTQTGAKATFDALDAGALDYISKSSSFVQLDIVEIEKDLLEKISFWNDHRKKGIKRAQPSAASALVSEPQKLTPAPFAALSTPSHVMDITETYLKDPVFRRTRSSAPPQVIVLGVSTGGPRQMIEMLSVMPKLRCPLIIAQHMGAAFTGGFAEHLARKSIHNVFEGKDRQLLQPGDVVVCPGGQNGWIERTLQGFALRVSPDPKVTVYPSVDLLFESAARHCSAAAGVILTGMGGDGTIGAQAMAAKDMPIIVQTPHSCIVGGMPDSALRSGCVTQMMSLAEIGVTLGRMAGIPIFERKQSTPA